MSLTALTYAIYQGDTGPILRPRPSVLGDATVIDANWSCWSAVIDSDGNTVVASREVTDLSGDSLRWIAALTPAETGSLDVSAAAGMAEYTWVIEVRNPSYAPPFNVETHVTLQVKPQGIV